VLPVMKTILHQHGIMAEHIIDSYG